MKSIYIYIYHTYIHTTFHTYLYLSCSLYDSILVEQSSPFAGTPTSNIWEFDLPTTTGTKDSRLTFLPAPQNGRVSGTNKNKVCVCCFDFMGSSGETLRAPPKGLGEKNIFQPSTLKPVGFNKIPPFFEVQVSGSCANLRPGCSTGRARRRGATCCGSPMVMCHGLGLVVRPGKREANAEAKRDAATPPWLRSINLASTPGRIFFLVKNGKI